MGNFFDLAQLRRVQLNEAEKIIAGLRDELRDADREIKALRDELDYVHQERDDLEKQLGIRPPIPWLREVEPDRWEITDRD